MTPDHAAFFLLIVLRLAISALRSSFVIRAQYRFIAYFGFNAIFRDLLLLSTRCRFVLLLLTESIRTSTLSDGRSICHISLDPERIAPIPVITSDPGIWRLVANPSSSVLMCSYWHP